MTEAERRDAGIAPLPESLPEALAARCSESDLVREALGEHLFEMVHREQEGGMERAQDLRDRAGARAEPAEALMIVPARS